MSIEVRKKNKKTTGQEERTAIIECDPVYLHCGLLKS